LPFPCLTSGISAGDISMKLTASERLNASSLLPEKGNFANLKILRKAREALSFNEEEVKFLEPKTEGNQIRWSAAGAEALGEVDVDLGESATGMIVTALTKLNDTEDLTDLSMSLYEKFVLNKE
jgi:hypothetical protein